MNAASVLALDSSKVQDINLSVLKRVDADVKQVLGTAAHVCLYAMTMDNPVWVREWQPCPQTRIICPDMLHHVWHPSIWPNTPCRSARTLRAACSGSSVGPHPAFSSLC